MFFTVEHRRQYGRIFHLLMRLKLARLVAQSGAFRWLMSRRLGGGGREWGVRGSLQCSVLMPFCPPVGSSCGADF